MLYISQHPTNLGAPRRNLIRVRQQPSEFEIQAFLYYELQKIGYHVRGELPAFGGKARFDLALFAAPKERWPLRIVEVKKRKRGISMMSSAGRQIHYYYNDFGIPVDLVGGMKEAIAYIEKVPRPGSPARTCNNPCASFLKSRRDVAADKRKLSDLKIDTAAIMAAHESEMRLDSSDEAPF